MQKYLTKEQFIRFKQWQWSYTFGLALTLIFFVDMKTALACTLVGFYSLLRCVKWGLFD